MYSNIPNELALRSVLSRWNLIEKNTSILFQEFKRAISIILNSTFFKFNEEFYEQIFGLPMGSPLSPILADLVIQDLEHNIFDILITHIPLYYRYVDDILLAAPTNQITNILDSFNAYQERIKFTVDYGDEFGISFLDVKLLYDKGSIIFDLYTKPTRRDTSIFSQITLPYTKKVW
ncbi:PREDICTED: telomerase reverse transcriptase-like [Trachymyrmex septentrionalis]|uniref:telomerase reverse transcriptase-like n=1 Tax=Trachymyrmex septentrionalis TaxID=34720 RepID=UPI00084F60F4|nr:PREDICTED: telomerase reverse transcriptase-like [Trachymyrmex septentrionalis]